MQRHRIVPCPMRLVLTHPLPALYKANHQPWRSRPSSRIVFASRCRVAVLRLQRHSLSLQVFPPPYFPSSRRPFAFLSLVHLRRYPPAFGLSLRTREAPFCFPPPPFALIWSPAGHALWIVSSPNGQVYVSPQSYFEFEPQRNTPSY
jgi:hypothetical protein